MSQKPEDLFAAWAGEVQRIKKAWDEESEETARQLGTNVEELRSGRHWLKKRREQNYAEWSQAGDYRNWRGTPTPGPSEQLPEALRGVWGKLSPEVQDELEAYLE